MKFLSGFAIKEDMNAMIRHHSDSSVHKVNTTMFILNILILLTIAGAYCEPLNFVNLARNVRANDAASSNPTGANEGYKYPKPTGYSYPKPTEGFGPTEETTDDPNEGTTEVTDPEVTTQNPQSETLRNIQASQYRRKNAKATNARIFQKKSESLVAGQEVQYFVGAQPVFYVDHVQPQYVYVF